MDNGHEYKEPGTESPLLTWPALIRDMVQKDQICLLLVFAVLSGSYLAVKLEAHRWRAYALLVAAVCFVILSLWVIVTARRARIRLQREKADFAVLQLRYSYKTIDPASLIVATGLRQQWDKWRKIGRIWKPDGATIGYPYIGTFLTDGTQLNSGTGYMEVSTIDSATGSIEEQITLLFDFGRREMTVEVGEAKSASTRKALFDRVKEKLSHVHGLQQIPLTPKVEADEAIPRELS